MTHEPLSARDVQGAAHALLNGDLLGLAWLTAKATPGEWFALAWELAVTLALAGADLDRARELLLDSAWREAE